MPLQSTTLSEDLWFLILALLPKSDLRRLCCVSKGFHALTIPILYRVIDLSVHRLEPMPTLDPRLMYLLAQQYLFVKQVLMKPEYGLYVQSFTWTMICSLYSQAPSTTNSMKTSWPIQETYYMFSLLSRARHVDLDTGRIHIGPLINFPSLFPSATSIRLGGKMHYALATAILHGENKAPLESLSLNNVQEGGLNHYGTNFGNGEPYRRMDLATIRENWPKGCLPIQVAPGNMRRLLTPSLQSRCQRLRYLFLRKQGQEKPNQGTPGPFERGPSFRTYEDDVYREWASFIRATRPNIVVFEHGGIVYQEPEMNTHIHSREKPLPPIPFMQIPPMDERFRNIILPVLEEGWPGLRRIEVRGVKMKVVKSLTRHSGVEVSIDERVTPCYNGMVGKD